MNILYTIPIMVLGKSGTFIIGPLADLLSYVMNFIFNFAYNISEKGSLGVSIIFFTLFVKLIMMPLMINQQKSMRRMQRIQPKIQRLQAKYKGKKDPESQQKMQQEMAKLYKKHKVNPFGGCLPLLIQMPIFFALFQVLRNIPFYITKVGILFEQISTKIMEVSNIGDVLTTFPAVKMIKGFTATSQDHVIDLLSKLSLNDWTTLSEQLPPDILNSIQPQIEASHRINYFFNFNLAEQPGWGFPAILFPIIAGLTTYLQSKLVTSSSTNKNSSKKTQQTDTAGQTQKTMNMIFPFITVFFTATMPLGLGIYWITSNVFQIVQQLILNKIFEKEEAERRARIRAKKLAKQQATGVKSTKNKSIPNDKTKKLDAKKNSDSSDKEVK